nr:hypothetical protein [Tanacetum cinerariifolium]
MNQLSIDIPIGLEEVHLLGARERVFVDGFEEGLSKTLASEEIPIDDVPKVNAASSKSIDIIKEFCSPSQWKELSKEMSSKILPCVDGSG